jgi:hypothetical protein
VPSRCHPECKVGSAIYAQSTVEEVCIYLAQNIRFDCTYLLILLKNPNRANLTSMSGCPYAGVHAGITNFSSSISQSAIANLITAPYKYKLPLHTMPTPKRKDPSRCSGWLLTQLSVTWSVHV